jgi:hypothetical protein
MYELPWWWSIWIETCRQTYKVPYKIKSVHLLVIKVIITQKWTEKHISKLKFSTSPGNEPRLPGLWPRSLGTVSIAATHFYAPRRDNSVNLGNAVWSRCFGVRYWSGTRDSCRLRNGNTCSEVVLGGGGVFCHALRRDWPLFLTFVTSWKHVAKRRWKSYAITSELGGVEWLAWCSGLLVPMQEYEVCSKIKQVSTRYRRGKSLYLPGIKPLFPSCVTPLTGFTAVPYSLKG